MHGVETLIPHSSPWISDSDKTNVLATLTSGQVAHGEVVESFEKQLSDYIDTSHVITTGSGREALTLALNVLELTNESEVILPTYVCGSVLSVVSACGAKPVLCDISDNWVMTPANVAPLVNENTAAIIIVHTFGFQAKVDEFKTFGCPIIEDACQAFGKFSDGHVSGTSGNFGICSFNATKQLTTGEGGALICGSNEDYEKAKKKSSLCRFIKLTSGFGSVSVK